MCVCIWVRRDDDYARLKKIEKCFKIKKKKIQFSIYMQYIEIRFLYNACVTYIFSVYSGKELNQPAGVFNETHTHMR